jgi:hypothetical protein
MVHDFFDGKILSAGLVIKSASFDIDWLSKRYDYR